MEKANVWYMIRIRRGDARRRRSARTNFTQTETAFVIYYKYYLDVNGHALNTSISAYEAGNEIRLKTVRSLWTSECDPRYNNTQPQPTNSTLPTSQLTITIATVSSVLFLVVILMTVILVIIHKRRNVTHLCPNQQITRTDFPDM
ncbi:unnamed protein product [Meganyctiphanes norvegica]|uniref:Uncharacterized protein n=1 Tax=Meganyctiphanes norvegica TaxID=48144 RepID=A0AAV2RI39_MEGNR